MCGIAGIFDFDERDVGSGEVTSMLNAIEHRGPDGRGVKCDGFVGVGSVRLSILDLSPAGHMPMIDPETGNWVVHNGEIYNYVELIERLDLGRPRTGTDTEIILKAYAKLGPDCVNEFNGIFAFAVWDAQKKELFCARDPLGVKPFFYTSWENRLCFASEIKGLFGAGIPQKPNAEIIHEYLTQGLYDHREETFFKDIFQIPPGHVLRVNHSKMEISPYWSLSSKIERAADQNFDRYSESGEYVEEYQSLLSKSVKYQLRTDTSVAVHISGGLDSALLLSAVHKHLGGQGQVYALSQNYGEQQYDETPFVESLVDSLNWSVSYEQITSEEIPELVQEAVIQQEQPFPGIVTLAKQNLIKRTHGLNAKVILEGQGGDEIAGGYQYYFGAFVMDLLEAGKAEQAQTEVEKFAKLNGLMVEEAMSIVFRGMAAYHSPGRSADGTKFLNTDFLDPEFARSYEKIFSPPAPFRSKLLNMQYRDIFHTKLPRILRSCDRASMAYGRELRVPLLDKNIVESSFFQPAEVKIHLGAQRRFMREALHKLNPKLGNVAPKRAVVDPQKAWLRGPLAEWVRDTLSGSSFRHRGVYNAKKALDGFERFAGDAGAPNSFHMWQMINLELWFQSFID